jgi:hypothetical protein
MVVGISGDAEISGDVEVCEEEEKLIGPIGDME